MVALSENRLRSFQKVTLGRNNASAQQQWRLYPSDVVQAALILHRAVSWPIHNPPPAIDQVLQTPSLDDLKQRVIELEQDRSNLVSAHTSQLAALEEDKNALQQKIVALQEDENALQQRFAALERDRTREAESHAVEIAALQRQIEEDERSFAVLEDDRFMAHASELAAVRQEGEDKAKALIKALQQKIATLERDREAATATHASDIAALRGQMDSTGFQSSGRSTRLPGSHSRRHEPKDSIVPDASGYRLRAKALYACKCCLTVHFCSCPLSLGNPL